MRPLTARGQATRDKLVAAARDVFADRGFAGTRMGDLADAAGVAHGTVYTYFDTKEDVLLAVLDAVRSDLHAAMTVPSVRDPIARIEAANRAYLDGYREHAQLLQVAQEAAAGDVRFADVLLDLRRTHVARVAAAIRKLQSDAMAAPDLDPHTAAAALCGMVEGFAAHWLGRGEAHDEVLATRTLTQLWVRGLGMPARIPPRQQRPGERPTAIAAGQAQVTGPGPHRLPPRGGVRAQVRPGAPAVAPGGPGGPGASPQARPSPSRAVAPRPGPTSAVPTSPVIRQPPTTSASRPTPHKETP